MNLTTVLQAIAALGSDVPAFVDLIHMVKTAFTATDQATIDEIMNSANAAADAQHKLAQSG